jgi:hypothetical protein
VIQGLLTVTTAYIPNGMLEYVNERNEEQYT